MQSWSRLECITIYTGSYVNKDWKFPISSELAIRSQVWFNVKFRHRSLSMCKPLVGIGRAAIKEDMLP